MTLSIMLNEPGGVRTDVVSGRINVRYMTTVNTQTKAVKKKSMMCVNNTVMSFCFDIILMGQRVVICALKQLRRCYTQHSLLYQSMASIAADTQSFV